MSRKSLYSPEFKSKIVLELLQGENQGICIAPMAPLAVFVSGGHVRGAGSGGVPQHQL